MCFKRLPIDFDAHGRPRLRDGWDIRSATAPAELTEVLATSERLRAFDIDPVTRVAGSLSFHTQVDLESRRVVEARTEAPLFRGYEVILKGREPTDAIHISSRACGVCGGVHAVCASMALEMAFNVAPPPLALIVRNLGEAAELVYDHTLHLFLLAGPDYSEKVVRRTTPRLWDRAERTPARHATTHGLHSIGEIMRGLNPLTGPLYLEALEITRNAREIASLMLGKYPHPSTIFPAGMGTEPSPEVFNQVLGRIVRLLDYAKKVAAIWDDLVDFFLEEQPGSEQVGLRPANLLCVGMWDEPEVYDASYARCAQWAERRLVTPGVVVNGQLRTTRLDHINVGIEEFVDHSYYERWEGHEFPTDPLGAPLSPFHPWNKQTLPDPTKRNWKDKYTWGTAPRWDREAMECGPLARHWITALAGRLDNPFLRGDASGLEIDVPKGETPAVTLRWRIPSLVNAFERNRARAYHVAYCGMAGYTFLLRAFDYVRRGETAMSTPFTIPDEAIGVGFWEAGRGALSHHIVLQNGRIANYQIVTPSTWMASPRDAFGAPGPYEEAALKTPVLEDFDTPDDFTGIDILRAVRSFDPCMPCTVHVFSGQGRVLRRDATTCACSLEA